MAGPLATAAPGSEEPLTFASGMVILASAAATIAYGGLLVFLAADHRYGWFTVAVGVPSAGYFAWRALDRAIARYDGAAPRQAPRPRRDVAAVESNYQRGGWAALQPTVDTLQASALDLFDRMIDPAEASA